MTTPKKTVLERRGFFKQFLVETIYLYEELKGRPQMSLNEIEHLPDEIVRQMAPAFNENRAARMKGNVLFLEDAQSGASKKVCELDDVKMFIWGCIDGRTDIESIGRRVEREFSLEFDRAYEETKSFFIFLAKRLICHPAEAHERVEAGVEG